MAAIQATAGAGEPDETTGPAQASSPPEDEADSAGRRVVRILILEDVAPTLNLRSAS